MACDWMSVVLAANQKQISVHILLLDDPELNKQTFKDECCSRYVKLRVTHAPRMPETFSSPPNSKGNR